MVRLFCMPLILLWFHSITANAWFCERPSCDHYNNLMVKRLPSKCHFRTQSLYQLSSLQVIKVKRYHNRVIGQNILRY